jgi:hypothetical protein
MTGNADILRLLLQHRLDEEDENFDDEDDDDDKDTRYDSTKFFTTVKFYSCNSFRTIGFYL